MGFKSAVDTSCICPFVVSEATYLGDFVRDPSFDDAVRKKIIKD